MTDRIKKKVFQGYVFPTEEMIADFFSKPLQGTKFGNFRKLIMNEKNRNEKTRKIYFRKNRNS